MAKIGVPAFVDPKFAGSIFVIVFFPPTSWYRYTPGSCTAAGSLGSPGATTGAGGGPGGVRTRSMAWMIASETFASFNCFNAVMLVSNLQFEVLIFPIMTSSPSPRLFISVIEALVSTSSAANDGVATETIATTANNASAYLIRCSPLPVNPQASNRHSAIQ